MISILIAVVVAGFCVWLVTLIPMQPVFRQVFIGLCVLFLILFLLNGFGFVDIGRHWRG